MALPTLSLRPEHVRLLGERNGACRRLNCVMLSAASSRPPPPASGCRKSISSEIIRAENLPPEQRRKLVEEGYLVGGVGEPAPSVIALTVLGAGLATCAPLALLSGEGDVCPAGYIVDGLMGDGLHRRPASWRCWRVSGKTLPRTTGSGWIGRSAPSIARGVDDRRRGGLLRAGRRPNAPSACRSAGL